MIILLLLMYYFMLYFIYLCLVNQSIRTIQQGWYYSIYNAFVLYWHCMYKRRSTDEPGLLLLTKRRADKIGFKIQNVYRRASTVRRSSAIFLASSLKSVLALSVFFNPIASFFAQSCLYLLSFSSLKSTASNKFWTASLAYDTNASLSPPSTSEATCSFHNFL